jgi:hypothetical protein
MIKRLSLSVRLFFISLLLVSFFSQPGYCRAVSKALPFGPGEKLTYRISWFFIPAGEASLEVLPVQTINGADTFHFQLKVKTYPVIDAIYKVRNQINAFVNLELTHSILYQKRQREGKTRKHVDVEFDWSKKEAYYTKNGEEKPPVPLSGQTLDPLSVLYYTRTHDLAENMVVKSPVTDGKRSFVGRASVVKKELVDLEIGSFESFLIEPDLSNVEGVFEKNPNAKLKVWLTADEHRIPVKVQSKVAIGHFTAELVSIEKRPSSIPSP